MNSMTLKELQTYILELNPYQFDQIASQVVKYLNLNEQLKNTRPECCPCCGKTGEHLIKKGFQHGKQRYMCKACGKKFTYDINQITAHSHQPVDAWITVIEDTLAMKSLDETAGKIGVCHETAFNMRHKLLAYLETMIETAKPPDELVETDETYVTESQKGVKCKNRKPRKHGESASKRGLSNEQYCICVVTDRNKNVFAKCVNRAKPSSEDIIKALSAHVSRKSVLLCDGAASYNQLADTLECKKIELIGHESYDKVYHLNTVNNLHSRIKRMLGQFRGVASKYLNRYLALFSVIVSCTKPSMNEFVDELRCTLSTIRVNVTYHSSQTIGILAF